MVLTSAMSAALKSHGKHFYYFSCMSKYDNIIHHHYGIFIDDDEQNHELRG
jgi:hypothetical protein